jgi:CRP/FNR family transcriptional regulator, cyclic AMP receptor protein
MIARVPPTWTVAGNPDELSAGQFGAMLIPAERARTGGPVPLFQGLTESEIARVMEAGKRKVLYRGATLFSEGSPQDGIYLVETGRIKVFYVGPSGREITLAYWHPGNFVGGPDVFNKGFHVWSGVAAVNSSVLHLPGHILKHMITKVPALAINVIEGLSFKGRCYSALAQMLGTHSPTERLAHLLLHLMALYGVEESKGVLIAASFTHADLAHMIGVTRQWVTTTLKRYAELGIAHPHGTNIVISDADALRKVRDEKQSKSDTPSED